MSADKQNGAHLFECDCCGDVFEGERGADFREAWERAKSEGWRTRKVEAVWVHACADCELRD